MVSEHEKEEIRKRVIDLYFNQHKTYAEIVQIEKISLRDSESHNNRIYNNTVSDSGSGIDIDEDSFENVVYNNTIINIPDPSEALHLRDGASEQNTLHFNTLITINGERISLDGGQE